MSRATPQQSGSRKISFNVSEQYDIQDVVGEGAYGVVCSALHKPSQQKVAIKKITPFDHSMFCLYEKKAVDYFGLLADDTIRWVLVAVAISGPLFDPGSLARIVNTGRGAGVWRRYCGGSLRAQVANKALFQSPHTS
ncbi:mitogen activated protein kinase [Oleoguttula sp. CCFEE 5521]